MGPMGDMFCVLFGLEHLLFADAHVENSAIIVSFIEAIHDFVAFFSLRFCPFCMSIHGVMYLNLCAFGINLGHSFIDMGIYAYMG